MADHPLGVSEPTAEEHTICAEGSHMSGGEVSVCEEWFTMLGV